MKAVYIVKSSKVSMVLIDPMRRAILDLLRQKPMTQAQMADKLGLTGASLNYHIKILRSKKLIVIAKKEYEKHRVKQIFFLVTAYLFVYDLETLPKNIAWYFFPVSLERARGIILMLIIGDRKNMARTPTISNNISERLSRQLVKVAKSFEGKEVNYADEMVIYDIYSKTIYQVLQKDQGLGLFRRALGILS